MFDTNVIQVIYKRNHNAIKGYVKDISEAESRIDPQPAGNNMNWNVGHIVSYRSYILGVLGQTAFWDEEASAPYTYNSPPLPRDKGMSFEALITLLDSSQEALIATLETSTDDFLAQELADGKNTIGSRLEFFSWHEGYHTGQLALLRRIVGKGNAY